MSEKKEPKPAKKCACGREMSWTWVDGMWLSLHHIWDGGSDFGRLSHVDCCKTCADRAHREMEDELAIWW